MEAVTMEMLITNISNFFESGVLEMGKSVLNLIAVQPIATLMVVCVPLCGLALGWVKRLLRV